MDDTEFHWEPAQDVTKQSADLRAQQGPIQRGYKVGYLSTANTVRTQPAAKRKRQRDEFEAEAEPEAMDASTSGAQPDLKRMRTVARDVVGVSASRPWKLPASGRCSSLVKTTAGKKTWDQKARAGGLWGAAAVARALGRQGCRQLAAHPCGKPRRVRWPGTAGRGGGGSGGVGQCTRSRFSRALRWRRRR